MEKLKLIVELKHTAALENNAFSMATGGGSTLKQASVLKSEFFKMDLDFGDALIPGLVKTQAKASEMDVFESSGEYILDSNQNGTFIIRGEVDRANLEMFEAEVKKDKNVVGVFSDVEIEPQLICASSGPVGNSSTVENLLCVSKMKEKGMTGSGVFVAVVDSGVNMAYLNSRGMTPNFNSVWSWKPATSPVSPGNAPIGHGTMCAYDVCIAAPRCTILDIALLTSRASGLSGLLSDAIKAYEHLIRFINRVKRPGENASLIVNNSWGMFHPSWDFPRGHSGNFSHNPNHPFNLIVRRLSLLGADILFAAGNCGPECPDGRCGGVTNGGIYGANSSPFVTTVAGIGTNFDRVGYSNRGPGCLTNKKPDITGFTHFSGSGVYSADGGTSAACPVVAGVFAAIRTVRPYNRASSITSPASIRNLVTGTARDIGASGWDYLYGFGVVNGCGIVNKIYPPKVSLCRVYPQICRILLRDKLKFAEFCKKYPKACNNIDRDRVILPIAISSIDESEYQPIDIDFIEDLLEYIETSFEGSESLLIKEENSHDCNCKK